MYTKTANRRERKGRSINRIAFHRGIQFPYRNRDTCNTECLVNFNKSRWDIKLVSLQILGLSNRESRPKVKLLPPVKPAQVVQTLLFMEIEKIVIYPFLSLLDGTISRIHQHLSLPKVESSRGPICWTKEEINRTGPHRLRLVPARNNFRSAEVLNDKLPSGCLVHPRGKHLGGLRCLMRPGPNRNHLELDRSAMYFRRQYCQHETHQNQPSQPDTHFQLFPLL